MPHVHSRLQAPHFNFMDFVRADLSDVISYIKPLSIHIKLLSCTDNYLIEPESYVVSISLNNAQLPWKQLVTGSTCLTRNKKIRTLCRYIFPKKIFKSVSINRPHLNDYFSTLKSTIKVYLFNWKLLVTWIYIIGKFEIREGKPILYVCFHWKQTGKENYFLNPLMAACKSKLICNKL